MSDTAEKLEGGCLCGAIRLVASGRPKGVYWCHCQSCRRHSGAPVSVFVAFEHSAYQMTKGEITKFDSTPGRTRRGFCSRCGSTLTCESAGLPADRSLPRSSHSPQLLLPSRPPSVSRVPKVKPLVIRPIAK